MVRKTLFSGNGFPLIAVSVALMIPGPLWASALELPARLVIKVKKDSLSRALARRASIGVHVQSDDVGSLRGQFLAGRRVLDFQKRPGKEKLQKIKNKLKKLSWVAEVYEDLAMSRQGSSFNDPAWQDQWDLKAHAGGMDFSKAHEIYGTPSVPIVVAVVDTGIVDNSEFAGRLLPGADLISSEFLSNDGDGRDTDASDPGDWIDSDDICYPGRFIASSWHGTHVAGTIGAASGNGEGIVGINANSLILPVRVLGKCGGYASDVADGIRWAAGLEVDGLPVNQNPARVINLSLGGRGECSEDLQEAIDQAILKGAVVVVAAGNSAVNIDYFSYAPAGCRGVISVGASNSAGGLASYSNYGSLVDIVAPGGEGESEIWSLVDRGVTVPEGVSLASMAGTSMATPHISGVISWMLALNETLASHQIEKILKDAAAPFGGSGCPSCGGGLAQIVKSLQLAETTIGEDPILPPMPLQRAPSTSAPQSFQPADDDDGVLGCGSVDIQGPGGPWKLLPLLLGLVLMFSTRRFSKN